MTGQSGAPARPGPACTAPGESRTGLLDDGPGSGVIGRGFLARHLRGIAARHPDVMVLAAGVSSTACTTDAEFRREQDLVSATITRCRAQGRRLVYLSTASTGLYGSAGPTAREDAPVTPRTPYGAHKRRMEELVAAAGVDHLTLRLSHVVGAGQPPYQLVPALIRQLRSGEVRVHGRATRDLIYVTDAVAIIDRLLDRRAINETVNVASGQSIPVPHMVDHLADRLGCAARRVVTIDGSAEHISVEKLRRLIDDTTTAIEPGYPLRTIDRYVRESEAG